MPDLEAHIEFCRSAERAGIEYLLTAFGSHRPARTTDRNQRARVSRSRAEET